MDDVIVLLEKLIAINSINPFSCTVDNPDSPAIWKIEGNEEAISDFIETELNRAGFTVEKQEVHRDIRGNAHYNLLAEKGDGDHSLLFYGHMDTVTARPWLSEAEALSPKRMTKELLGKEREVMVGLGACDMKAGLAVMISAFKEFTPPGFKLKLAFGVDEEYYSLGANILAASSFMDDVRGIVVPEIDDGPNASFGPRTITLGRLGRCEYIIHVPGTGGHGAEAKHTDHVNAASECAKIVARIEEMATLHGDSFCFVPTCHSDERLKQHIEGSLYVNRLEAGDGTISIPADGKVSISYTFTPSSSIDKGQKLFENLIDRMYRKNELKKTRISGTFVPVSVKLKERPTPPSTAFYTPVDHRFTHFIQKTMEKTLGFKCFNMGYSVADENVFSRTRPEIPVLDIGPIGSNYHRADEWVDIASIYDLEHLYQQIAENFESYLEI